MPASVAARLAGVLADSSFFITSMVYIDRRLAKNDTHIQLSLYLHFYLLYLLLNSCDGNDAK